jgi:hypothetical protein
MRFGQQLRTLWMWATVMLSDQHLGSDHEPVEIACAIEVTAAGVGQSGHGPTRLAGVCANTHVPMVQRKGDYICVEPELPTVSVRLWRADAVVLFDWLMSTDLNLVPVEHPAQKQALADLLSRLEWDVDAEIAGSTAEEVAAAREQVARNMGW